MPSSRISRWIVCLGEFSDQKRELVLPRSAPKTSICRPRVSLNQLGIFKNFCGWPRPCVTNIGNLMQASHLCLGPVHTVLAVCQGRMFPFPFGCMLTPSGEPGPPLEKHAVPRGFLQTSLLVVFKIPFFFVGPAACPGRIRRVFVSFYLSRVKLPVFWSTSSLTVGHSSLNIRASKHPQQQVS